MISQEHEIQTPSATEAPICFRLSYKSYLPEITQRIVLKAEHFEQSFQQNHTIKEWFSLYQARWDWQDSNDGQVYETACFVAHEKLMADQYQHYIKMLDIQESEQVTEVLHFILHRLQHDPEAIARLKNEADIIADFELQSTKYPDIVSYLCSERYMRYWKILRSASRTQEEIVE